MNEFGLNTDVANAAATGSTTQFAEALEKELKEDKSVDEKGDDKMKGEERKDDQ